MKEGYLQIRNRALAYVFSYMNLIEGWGTGIPRLIREMKEYGLQEPEFIDMEIALRINLYRNVSDAELDMEASQSAGKVPEKCRKSAGKVPETHSWPEQQQKIMEYIKENGQIVSAEAEELLGVKQRRARIVLNDMVKNGLIIKVGASRGTRYVLSE